MSAFKVKTHLPTNLSAWAWREGREVELFDEAKGTPPFPTSKINCLHQKSADRKDENLKLASPSECLDLGTRCAPSYRQNPLRCGCPQGEQGKKHRLYAHSARQAFRPLGTRCAPCYRKNQLRCGHLQEEPSNTAIA